MWLYVASGKSWNHITGHIIRFLHFSDCQFVIVFIERQSFQFSNDFHYTINLLFAYVVYCVQQHSYTNENETDTDDILNIRTHAYTDSQTQHTRTVAHTHTQSIFQMDIGCIQMSVGIPYVSYCEYSSVWHTLLHSSQNQIIRSLSVYWASICTQTVDWRPHHFNGTVH